MLIKILYPDQEVLLGFFLTMGVAFMPIPCAHIWSKLAHLKMLGCSLAIVSIW